MKKLKTVFQTNMRENQCQMSTGFNAVTWLTDFTLTTFETIDNDSMQRFIDSFDDDLIGFENTLMYQFDTGSLPAKGTLLYALYTIIKRYFVPPALPTTTFSPLGNFQPNLVTQNPGCNTHTHGRNCTCISEFHGDETDCTCLSNCGSGEICFHHCYQCATTSLESVRTHNRTRHECVCGGYTIFMTSVMFGNYNFIAWLINVHHANVNLGSSNRLTPMMIAAKLNLCKIMRLLRNNGAELERTDEFGRTALFHAVRKGNIDAVQLLIGFGANVRHRDSDGWNLLHNAAEKSPSLELMKLLIFHGVDPLVHDHLGRTLLMIIFGDIVDRPEKIKLVQGRIIEILEFFRNYRVDFNTFVFDDINANGEPGQCDTILTRMIDIANEFYYEYPEMRSEINAAIAYLLRIPGIKISWNAVTNGNHGPVANLYGPLVDLIPVADEQLAITMIEKIVAEGSDPFEPNGQGDTPWGEAICRNYLNIIKEFVRYGMDLTIVRDHGKTPLQIAEEIGKHDIVEYIREQLSAATTSLETNSDASSDESGDEQSPKRQRCN